MLISPNFSLDQARRAIRVNGRFGRGGCDRDKLSRTLTDWALHLVDHWVGKPDWIGYFRIPFLTFLREHLPGLPEKKRGKEEIFLFVKALMGWARSHLDNAKKENIERLIEKFRHELSPRLIARYDRLERLAVLSLREAIGPLEVFPPAHGPQIAQDVPGLIRAIESGEGVHPILADALEDSGYACDAVLAHLRHTPHVFPGLPCWAISVVLNRHPFQRGT